MKNKINKILSNFPVIVNPEAIQIETINSGHINDTFKIGTDHGSFILQRINTNIFTNPTAIIHNGKIVSDYLKKKGYSKKLLEFFPTQEGQYFIVYDDGIWRLGNFIEDSFCLEKAETKEMAYQCAQLIGEFHSFLEDIPLETIESPLPDFLNFEKRWIDFEKSVTNTTEDLKKQSKQEIEYLMDHHYILKDFINIEKYLPRRIIHADPKISNILLDKSTHEPIAVIDWDTIMTGSILYDFADMIRSYTNNYNEDEIGDHTFNKDIYDAVKEGFLSSAQSFLTNSEKENLDLSAKAIIYIQALRFATDYLNGSQYYKISYLDQNLNRTKNQINLLRSL